MNTIKTCVIFDFDGTLLDSIGDAYKGMCGIFEAEKLKAPSFHEFSTQFKPPYMDFYRTRGVKAKEEDMWVIYHRIAAHQKALLFADAEDIIGRLAMLDIPMGIVSSQRQTVLDGHCSAGFGDFFAHILGDIEYKAAAIQDVAHRLGFEMEHAYYVGDFVSDVVAAAEAGAIPVGITRNWPVREALVAAGARHCIDHLEELIPIVTGRH